MIPPGIRLPGEAYHAFAGPEKNAFLSGVALGSAQQNELPGAGTTAYRRRVANGVGTGAIVPSDTTGIAVLLDELLEVLEGDAHVVARDPAATESVGLILKGVPCQLTGPHALH